MTPEPNEIRIQCPECNTRIVVPEDDYPLDTPCPTCNAPIGQLIATARLTRAQTAPPPPRPPGHSTRIKKMGSSRFKAVTTAVPYCVHHPEKTAAQHCMTCNKPICLTCVQERGLYCSNTCKESLLDQIRNTQEPESINRPPEPEVKKGFFGGIFKKK